MAPHADAAERRVSGALAIFAKTPGLSPIKTRLADGLGAQKAAEFYRLSVRCLDALAHEVAQLSAGALVPYWAVGEREALGHSLWSGHARLWTGEGGLGRRLDRVYATLLARHDHVLLIGSDSPQLRARTVLAAHRHLLKKKGPVIAPTDDGGYYLFGGHAPIGSEVWTSVHYSAATTCAEFSARLRADGPLRTLESGFDVDVPSDLDKLLRRGATMKGAAQRELRDWVERVRSGPASAQTRGDDQHGA